MKHVIPTNDDREHEYNTTCDCEPEVDWDASIVIHNAFDKREEHEKRTGTPLAPNKKWELREVDE